MFRTWPFDALPSGLPESVLTFFTRSTNLSFLQIDGSTVTTQFGGGKLALQAYRSAKMKTRGRASQQPPKLPSGYIDWNKIDVSDSESEIGEWDRKKRKVYTEPDLSGIEQ